MATEREKLVEDMNRLLDAKFEAFKAETFGKQVKGEESPDQGKSEGGEDQELTREYIRSIAGTAEYDKQEARINAWVKKQFPN